MFGFTTLEEVSSFKFQNSGKKPLPLPKSPKEKHWDLRFSVEQEIEKGRKAPSLWNAICGCELGEEIAAEWKFSCGGPQAELLALAVKETLGFELDIQGPFHRAGKVGKNQLRPCRDYKVVSALLSKGYGRSPYRIWQQVCLFVCRQYGYTQQRLSFAGEVHVYRGITGYVYNCWKRGGSGFDTRTLVSWTRDPETAQGFSERNGEGTVLEKKFPAEFVFAQSGSSVIVNDTEEELLIINPRAKTVDADEMIDFEETNYAMMAVAQKLVKDTENFWEGCHLLGISAKQLYEGLSNP